MSGDRRRAAGKRNFLLLVSVITLLLSSGCGAKVTPPPPVLVRAAGSTTMEPLFTALTDAYSQEYSYVSFDIERGGSELGQELAESEQVDIGLISWPPKSLADDQRLVPIARDAIAVIVHPQNEVAGLSLAELRRIFSGDSLEWEAVDSPSGSIQVIIREDGSGTRAAFEALVMDGQAVTSNAVILPTSQAVVDFVADTPKAIGYVSLAFADERVRAVPIDGILPTLETLKANQYLLTRELALLVPRQNSPEIRKLIEFALSPAGQQIVGERWGRLR